MTTRVLFMCPHAAGKSLAAATYFRAAAARGGLDVEIDVAGPEPDAENMPNVVAALEAQGFGIGWRPKRVEASDTAVADLLVNIGCPTDSLPTDGEPINWDVPMLSEDFLGSLRAIHDRAEDLARDLSPPR